MDRSALTALIAAYPALYIASASPGQVSLTSLGIAVVILVCAAYTVQVVAGLILRSQVRAALVVALSIALFFAYGPVHSYLESAQFVAGVTMPETTSPAGSLRAGLLSAAFLCLGAGIWGIAGMREAGARRILSGVNVGGLALLAMTSVQYLAGASSNGAAHTSVHAEPDASTAHAPDIYYIILDGYARGDVLRAHYGFDNDKFESALRSRGFFVTASNSANYYWTFLSLASSLNLEYVQDLLRGKLNLRSVDRGPLYEAIRNNELSRFLRSRGYSIQHVQSTWGATQDNPYADRQVRCAGGVFANEYFRAIRDMSMLNALPSAASIDLAQCHLSNFRALARMGRSPGPKFVFAHFLLPHHPYLFNANGEVLRNATVSDQFELQKRLWEDRASYVEQLRFVNSQVLVAIDGILASSAKRPIIVLQSDHGPNLKNNLTLEQQTMVRFPNFAGFLLPGAPAGLIPTVGTPVNYFRRILNYYFSAGLPILPDRHFFSTYQQPLTFIEKEAAYHDLRGEERTGGGATAISCATVNCLAN